MKKFLFALTFIILFLPGCINYIQDVHLYADGSGDMRVHYWMKLKDEDEFKILDRLGVFNADSVRNEFSSPYNKVENVRVFTDSTDSTTHAIVDLTYSHIDSLNYTKAFATYNFSLRDGAGGLKVFSQFIPHIATGFGINPGNFHVEYKYTFGGDIITNNATSVNGRVLIWDYTLADIGNGKTISVTFRPFRLKKTPTWIYILSGFVSLIVLIFLFRKKRN